jgi:hypothetical protein
MCMCCGRCPTIFAVGEDLDQLWDGGLSQHTCREPCGLRAYFTAPVIEPRPDEVR